MGNGPDFNDLHVAGGLDAVRAQLDAVLADFKPVPAKAVAGEFLGHVEALGFTPDELINLGEPPGYLMAPPDLDLPGNSPGPSGDAVPSLESLLRRYQLLMPDGKVWDSFKFQIIKKTAFRDYVTAPVFKQWMEHPERCTVDKSVVLKKLPPPTDGARGLAGALGRYVYVNPSDFAWDKQTLETVPLSHLRFAIADCFDDWIKHPGRVEVPKANLVFDPSQKCNPDTHINTFRGFPISPDDNPAACSRICHALFNLCNKDAEVYTWLLYWLAYPLQNPGAKMATAVLCHSSVHGSGKSYFFDVVMRAIYGEYSKTVGQAQLEGNYNDWMSRTLYACYEEVLSRGQKYSHTGTLKQMITGTTVRIDKKFQSGWEESNHMNAVFLSNEVLPLPVEPSDRRFLVIWPEEQMYKELQTGVDFEMANGGAEAFYGYLLSLDLILNDEPFGPHTKPPMTEAKKRLIEHGLPIWEVFFNEWEAGRLRHNDRPVPYCPCRVGDLFKVFDVWTTRHKESGMGSHKFQSFIGTKVRKKRDVDYSVGAAMQKATFFIPHDMNAPDGVTQKEWLGGCVAEFGRLFVGDEGGNP